LATGEDSLVLVRGRMTVRAAQFSIDPAIVRVVVQSGTSSTAALATPAPASEALIWLPIEKAVPTKIQISALPASVARTLPLTRGATPRRKTSAKPSRSALASRGGKIHRPDPEDLVFHPDAMEAYDDPPVPSDGGSLGVVLESDLPDGIMAGAKVALSGNHRYVWGGTTPNGFDCSGMMQFIYRYAELTLPRTAAEQFQKGVPVASSDLRPGDLLFFSRGDHVFHVGMYIGKGRFFHACNPKRGLATDLLSSSFYSKHYAGARRYF
jgi:cell wall-associated NlpC family hydrolase